jgi:hypothetical protein
VRTVLRSSMVAVGLSAVVLAACGKSGAPSNRAMSDDLKRDLRLASSTNLDLASRQTSASFPLTEISQSSAPAPAKTLKKSAGPKATRSRTPTVKATPENSVAAADETPKVEVTAQAPAPTPEPVPEPAAPAVPRPTPVPAQPTSDGGGGSVLGGIFGAILRGGVVDGDHCDPRTDGRHGRRGGPTSTLPQIPSGVFNPRGGIFERGR